MKIHHLNCGTLYPRFPRGTQSILYCLLIEAEDSLTLVDTGFGIQDYLSPTLFVRLFITSLGMKRRLEETAAYQVEALGYSRGDVKHIVVTHLHCDHAGGLRDFPQAQVHVYAEEYQATQHPKGLKERFYEQVQWAHGPLWEVYSAEKAQDWYGFPSIRVNTEQDIRLVPLPGHTRGHCGVAIKSPPGWLLHCGDATWPFYCQNKPMPPYHPLPSYVMSPPRWLETSLVGRQTPRLKELYQKHGEQVELICSNDLITFSMKNS